MRKLPLEEVIALLNDRRFFISIDRYETFHSGSEPQSFYIQKDSVPEECDILLVDFSPPWNSCKIGW